MAYQGHIVVPTTHDKADSVIKALTSKMVVTFGGYSQYEGVGGWDGENGVATENHVRLVVSTSGWERKKFKEYLTIEAEFVKDMLDEEAVLIEIREIDMVLV